MAADFNRSVYFLTVCDCGSISKAAEKLYISPQALNRQIKLLESELGQPLFLRGGRRLELSPFGTFFRDRMLPVYQLYLNVGMEVESYVSASSTVLKLGFFQGLPKKRVVLPIVEEILSRRPELKIELFSADMEAIYTELREKKTDLALTFVSPVDRIEDLKVLPLLELECSIVVSDQHPWAKKDRVTAEDMASQPVLFLSRRNGPDTEGFYSELKASSYHFINDSIAMVAQLGLGQHYAVFPSDFNALDGSGLVSLPLPEGMNAGFTLSLVHSPDAPLASFFDQLAGLQNSFGKPADSPC